MILGIWGLLIYKGVLLKGFKEVLLVVNIKSIFEVS